MNTKKSQHSIYLDLENSIMLKKIGFPQDNVSAYWFKNDGKIYPASMIPRNKDFNKLYTAAPMDAELEYILPDKYSVNRDGIYYTLECPDFPKMKFCGTSSVQVKAMLIKYLRKNNLIIF